MSVDGLKNLTNLRSLALSYRISLENVDALKELRSCRNVATAKPPRTVWTR